MKIVMYSLAALVFCAGVLATLLYASALDWQRKHSSMVAQLPLYRTGAGDGEFRIEANGYTFRARLYGMQNTGDALILLHGFPESSLLWEPLARAAARSGMRVLAFDQRGYSPGARPSSRGDYQLALLAEDVTALAGTLAFSRFHLVGHDWGAAVGWATVLDNPDRVLSWTAMAIPHVAAFMDSVGNDPEQRARSDYFDFLRKPLLPEYFFTYLGQRNMERMLARLPEHHRSEYLAILAEPGALTAALNWYRAMDADALSQHHVYGGNVRTPTLFLWGTDDGVIAETTIKKAREKMAGPYTEVALDHGHALMQQAEDRVVTEILDHLSTYSLRPVSKDEQA